VAKVNSGVFWVTWAGVNAKNSALVQDLQDPFRSNAQAFVDALRNAGCTVTVRATRRSEKRAYLFHWCWRIGLAKAAASQATVMAGVDIQWDHGSAEASIKGAKEMIDGFDLAIPPASVNPPALNSNHIAGKAIDIDIAWTGTIPIKKRDGTVEMVPFMPNVNANTKLHTVGATYGVRKLTTDAPHWSFDGH
jgi:hypothetical protein